jgi:hypothetical protein
LFLIGRFLKIFSEAAWPNEPKLAMMHHMEVLYKYYLEIDQSKTGIACGSHVCKWIKTK